MYGFHLSPGPHLRPPLPPFVECRNDGSAFRHVAESASPSEHEQWVLRRLNLFINPFPGFPRRPSSSLCFSFFRPFCRLFLLAYKSSRAEAPESGPPSGLLLPIGSWRWHAVTQFPSAAPASSHSLFRKTPSRHTRCRLLRPLLLLLLHPLPRLEEVRRRHRPPLQEDFAGWPILHHDPRLLPVTGYVYSRFSTAIDYSLD